MSTATAPLDELKTRARIALNAARRAGNHDAKLRHSLNGAAQHAGFAHWDHARTVLSGFAQPGDDFGTFWHVARTGSLLNQWFATHAEARAVHAQDPGAFLLPYRRQCMLVLAEFVAELGVDPHDPAWAALGRDVVAGYGSPAWARLVRLRLAQMRA